MNFMKKLKYILIIAFFLCFVSNVNAASCKPAAMEEITYSQGNYGDIGYCDLSVNNMLDSGCMPTAYAIVVANLVDSSVTPVTIRDNICENSNLRDPVRGPDGNGPGQASYMFGNQTYALEHARQYDLTITRTDERNIEQIKNILREENSMLIASIKCPGGTNSDPGCFFTTSPRGHYIVLSNVTDDGEIVVLNPGRQETAKGSYEDSFIEENVLNVVNQGIWKITGNPDNCSKVNSDSSSSGSGSGTDVGGGRLEDEYDEWGDIFPGFDPVDNNGGCSTIFVSSDGSYTALYDFMQDLFNLIKIVAPALVIILSTIDYIKAITNSNADEMKKANGRTIKRLIIGLIIFFLPFILDILFELLGLYDLSRCNIGT